MKWKIFIFRYFKLHFVPEPLWEVIKDDAKSRGHEFLYEKETKEIYIDSGNTYITSMDDNLVFDLPSLKLKIKAEMVEYILKRLKNINKRFGLNKEYYKLHFSHCHCLCLSSEMCASLVKQITERLPESKILSIRVDNELESKIELLEEEKYKINE